MTEELNTRTRSGVKAKLIITGKKEESNLVSVFHYPCSSPFLLSETKASWTGLHSSCPLVFTMQLTGRQEKLCRGNCQIESCPNNKKCFQVTATVNCHTSTAKGKKTSPLSIFENKILQPAKSAKISFSKMYAYVNVNITDVSAPYFQKKLLCIFTLNKMLCRN